MHPPENVVLHHLDPGPVAPEAAAAPDPGLPAVPARHGRGELLAQAGVAPGEQLPGEGVGTGLGGQLPAACRGVDIAVDIDCSHLTMTQKCGRWLKVSSLGKELLDTVSSNVWSTQAARQGFTSPLSTIWRYFPTMEML